MTQTTTTPSRITPAPLPRKRRKGASALARWAKHVFSRDHVIDSLRTLVWIIPLTLLIWIWAEREQQKPASLLVPFEVRISDPRKVVRLQEPVDLRVDIKGPNAQIEQMRSLFDTGAVVSPLRIEVQANLPGGPHMIQIGIDQIQADPIFENSGLTVEAVSPRGFEIYVDPIVEWTIPVRAPDGIQALAAPPVFTPSTVTVSGPESILRAASDRLRQDGPADPSGHGLVAWAELASLPEINEPGPHPNIPNIRLRFDFLDRAGISVSQRTVTASLEVKRPDASFKLGGVPIFVVAAPGLLDEYRLDLGDQKNVPNVTVTGTEDLIAKLKAGTLQPAPAATIEVTFDDVGRKQSRKVGFILPEGLKVSNADGDKMVSFELVPRKPGE